METADRQLKCSRKFLEEATSERDKELDELTNTNLELHTQLKDKEALQAQLSLRQKEVKNAIFISKILLTP